MFFERSPQNGPTVDSRNNDVTEQLSRCPNEDSLRVLVVDDSQGARQVLAGALASNGFEAGVDTGAVQRMLGHKRIETTAIYNHVTRYRLTAHVETEILNVPPMRVYRWDKHESAEAAS